MTHTALSIALAAIIAAAAIALGAPAPAAAQGGAMMLDDPGNASSEITGQIVARRLSNGRTELGWQPSEGKRVLPSFRYFPADASVGRWLSTSPVEIDDIEYGSISARLLSDSRIEFGFTPTDGEHILPELRFFPTGARVGRWLRSSEITITIADDSMDDGAMMGEATESSEQGAESQTVTQPTTESGGTTSAGATEGITGRIAIRRLDDERTEFGWLPSGSDALILPSDRYLPAGVQVTDWLSTGPVSVGGVDIGHIDMRRASDGRIEFGFTPTNGERILPDARYVPADPQVDRWLRSTTIRFGIAGGSETEGSEDGRTTVPIVKQQQEEPDDTLTVTLPNTTVGLATPTSTSTSQFVQPGPDATLSNIPSAPASFIQYSAVLLPWMHGRTTVDQIVDVFFNWPMPPLFSGNDRLVLIDTDGDGTFSVAMVFTDPDSFGTAVPFSNLVIYDPVPDRPDRYRIGYDHRLAYGREVQGLQMLSDLDLTGDGIRDLTLREVVCSERVCTSAFYVLRAVGDGYSVLTGPDALINEVESMQIADGTADGVLDLIVSGTEVDDGKTYSFTLSVQSGELVEVSRRRAGELAP